MPDVTLQDVLDELEKIIKKLNKIKDQVEIWDICTTCKGLGYTITYSDVSSAGRIEVHTLCPTCVGVKKLRKGQLEGGVEG